MVFLVNIVFSFHPGVSITIDFLLVNVYLTQNMIKNSMKYQFLCFFHNIRPNLVQILPQRPHPIYFLWLISSEICPLQLILITCVETPQFLKKLAKTLKSYFFWTKFAQKMGHYGLRPRWKKNFF